MRKKLLHTIAALFIVIGMFLLPALVKAQESDSTYQHSLNTSQRRSIPGNTDRSLTDGLMNKNGTYEVPTPKKHYHAPFKGQYYLDAALEAYRESLGPQVDGGGIWGIINFLAPFINNRFEFGVYKINDVPVVDRNNALFQTGD